VSKVKAVLKDGFPITQELDFISEEIEVVRQGFHKIIKIIIARLHP
jgi:hypothetical protein